MRLLVIALIFLTAVGVLVGVGVQASSIPIVSYGQLVRESKQYVGRNVRVDDALIVSIEQRFPSVKFHVAPEGFENPMLVVSDTAPPENFEVGRRVGIEGGYDPVAHKFVAYKMTTKCPSRYDAKAEGDRILREQKEAAAGGKPKESPGYPSRGANSAVEKTGS